MKFFEELAFPPPNLNPKSRKLAFRCEKITKNFIKQVRRLDRKMWIAVCKLMVDRRNFECPEDEALDRALDGIMEQCEKTSKQYHYKVEALGEMLKIEMPIYPFDCLKDDVRAELEGIVKITFDYFKVLGELQMFLLDKG